MDDDYFSALVEDHDSTIAIHTDNLLAESGSICVRISAAYNFSKDCLDDYAAFTNTATFLETSYIILYIAPDFHCLNHRRFNAAVERGVESLKKELWLNELLLHKEHHTSILWFYRYRVLTALYPSISKEQFCYEVNLACQCSKEYTRLYYAHEHIIRLKKRYGEQFMYCARTIIEEFLVKQPQELTIATLLN
ncbi:hypothetical protein PCE1_001878 [Barthelona sp. PCE]